MADRATSVGVDVGGTFTDLVLVHANGEVHARKVMTTPEDRSVGVMQSVAQAEQPASGASRDSALVAADVQRFVHGTTVVTNLLLERSGARVVLLATAGFTDLLWLRRQQRASLYDLTLHHRPPLVSRGDVIAVRERVAPQWMQGDTRLEVPEGVEVLTSLTEAEIERVTRAAVESGAQSFAIALLHSHVFHAHEQALRDALERAMPHATIAASHEVLPEIREYERTATTVAEAYARPAVVRYMQSLSDAVQARGLPAPRVMTSAGGTLSATEARVHASSLALSGPAGGVTAAAAWCRLMGVANALTIDIGGTSADVGLIVQGEPLIERGGDVDGIPIGLPRVLVETVAAGGGSIGRVDAGGALHAGPQSAGAMPGPACYGRGGSDATVTDAHVVLGHIDEGDWGGAVRIDRSLATEAVATLAAALVRSNSECAAALIATADATMARALRRVSVERGLDPRDLALVAFGGGGPLHACGLADALGMRTVIVPPFAGVLSALGLALAPERRDGLMSLMQRSDRLSSSALHDARRAVITRLRGAEGASAGAAAGASADASVESCWARVRFVGQGHELDVPFSADDTVEALVDRFRAQHEAQFGFSMDRLTEIVSIRVVLDGSWWPFAATRAARQNNLIAAEQSLRTVETMDTGPAVQAQPHEFSGTDDGRQLDATVDGPRTVRLPDATLRVAAGWRAEAQKRGGWLLTREVGA